MLAPGIFRASEDSKPYLKHLDDLEDGEVSRVMVYLKPDRSLDSELARIESKGYSRDRFLDKKHAAITKSVRANQERVLDRHGGLDVKFRFSLINGFSAVLSRDEIDELRRDPDVEGIEPVGWYKPRSYQTRHLLKTTKVWNLQYYGDNVTGAGQTICVLDTGIDYGHKDFGSCTLGEIHAGNCDKIPYCYDFYANPGTDDDCDDPDSHGTNVAGLAAAYEGSRAVGFSTNFTGVAPDAKIVPLKVVDSIGNLDYAGPFDALANAIEACTINKTEWGVSVMLIGVSSDCDFDGDYPDGYACSCSRSTCAGFPAWDGGTGVALEAAYDAGIFIVGPSGNSENETAIDYPACNEHVFSVAAVNKSDNVWDNSNSCDILDMWAPGYDTRWFGIWGPKDGTVDEYDAKAGTSQAAAHVAGAALLMQQYALLLNGSMLEVDRLALALNSTGKDVTRGALTRPRLDTFEAVRFYNFQAPRLSGGCDQYLGNTSTLFNFTVLYEDADDRAASYMDVIIDGVVYSMQKTASIDYYNGVTYYFNTTLASGVHWFYFNASDGDYTNTTGLSATNVSVNDQFFFHSTQVDPTDGTPSTVFNFSVEYRDQDDDAPVYVNVIVDGVLHALDPNGTDYDAGILCHWDTSGLAYGSHTYYFNASDGNYTKWTSDISDLLVHTPPSTANPGVSPLFGEANVQLFNFTVDYVDADDDAPSYVRVRVDGAAGIDMKSTGGTDYDGGVKFYRNITLSAGWHDYNFTVNDGYYSFESAPLTNPEVFAQNAACVGASPEEAVWDVDEDTTCTDTIMVPTDPHTGHVQVTAGNTLTLSDSTVYLNNTLAKIDGRMVLDDSLFKFIR